MRAVVQRASRSSVHVDGELVGAIDRGLLVLLAIAPDDTDADVRWMATKIAGLRIFPSDGGRMDRSVVDVGGGVLLVSQFTLYGDVRKGRRPSFVGAANPTLAEPRWREVAAALAVAGVGRVELGRFGASMEVGLVGDGPVTVLLDSPR